MRNPLNTLFGRMALLSTAVLFAVQAGWFALLTTQPPRHEVDGFARGLLLVLQAANGEESSNVTLAPALHVHLVPTWNMPGTVQLREPTGAPYVELVQHLRARLPTGTQIAVDDARPPRLWVRFPGKSTWIVSPVDIPPRPNFVIEALSMLLAALLLSLLAAWQMQRPLSRVADAARAFGDGSRPREVGERGPRELRDLIHSFNDMMRRLNEADADKAIMLAGVAHDLKAPLTRLKLRASVSVAEQERGDFIRDIDSLTHIVQQFLEFAGQTSDSGPPIPVDEFLREQFPVSGEDAEDAPLFELSLTAGPAFLLPRTLIDRLVTNLVDNALEHGMPPVQISTSRTDSDWIISVRDHGDGIAEDKVALAMKPFVRLDSARGGEGHCGLGLAIVARLAHDHGGRCDVSNADDGGLHVRIVLPIERARD
ncbi:HAMP domain-containing protein [Trinickia terrae]|uniref:Signal transduction histidine-protein kinase/phosphatase MprB n=1 Tax=Trinickia terrae TaxID=2571161 RepID=A0A4U1HX36_9BURK|nr:ATP-binding protein [Trinickia terrae]TKC86222.1 HAMP domain-containing protein [Trinickia terrae]